ncbi:hypothetical protein [Corynebacterium aquilae]|uniref:Uncharacterized protein n=1 Tax=Corynebacterium aquilae DSM 44791 TaxID=1431546 RepID=A0A1L7CGR5_9CORY|nr:hypothetical protein [Corynebacterium aquilae]APT85015.1 hypothetical protein CAQU_07930 [Corynebacterium aquilae DSM 44791]
MSTPSRDTHTDIQALLPPHELEASLPTWQSALTTAGITGADIHVEPISLSCEPDNMLVTEYEQTHGAPPITEVLHRIVVNAHTALNERDLTKAIVDCLPAGTPWYGTSGDGHIDPGANAACNISY